MQADRLIIIHSFPIWLPQTQTWMYHQVKFLPEQVESHVVCERTENLDQFWVPNIHCLHESSLLNYVGEKAVRRTIIPRHRGFLDLQARNLNAQILHSHFGNIGWLDSDVPKKYGMQHVVTFYGYDVNMLPTMEKRWRSRYRELFDQAELFLCEGPFMARDLIRLGAPQEKVKVHHLGVDIGSIPFKPRHWEHQGPLRILIIASFQEKKGIPDALEALAQLHDHVPIEITIIGDAVKQSRSEREKKRILDVIEKKGIKSKTRLLGFQPYPVVFDEAYRHHILISPSVTASDGDSEGGAPVTLIEIMASGMPVVSTSHCDIPEVVQYGMDDWLVPERDVDGLVKRLEWLINHHIEWNGFLKIGRRHVEAEFNALEQGKHLSSLYLGLLT